MAVGTAIGLAGLAASAYGSYSQNETAMDNARIARESGEAQSISIRAGNRRLADEQREIKSSQRVKVASGGAGSGQSQPLMILADQANKMNLDQVELNRQAGIAKQHGKSQSLIAKLQGQSNLISGGARVAGQGYNLYNSYKAGQST